MRKSVDFIGRIVFVLNHIRKCDDETPDKLSTGHVAHADPFLAAAVVNALEKTHAREHALHSHFGVVCPQVLIQGLLYLSCVFHIMVLSVEQYCGFVTFCLSDFRYES
jgi:hypothetical protein